jgi:hypothetical protein
VGEEHRHKLVKPCIITAMKLTAFEDPFAIATYSCMSKLLLLLLHQTTSVQHAADLAYDNSTFADTGSANDQRTSIRRLVGTAQARQLSAVGTSVCIAPALHTRAFTTTCKLVCYCNSIASEEAPSACLALDGMPPH